MESHIYDDWDLYDPLDDYGDDMRDDWELWEEDEEWRDLGLEHDVEAAYFDEAAYFEWRDEHPIRAFLADARWELRMLKTRVLDSIKARLRR